ncbi:MAG: DUF4831 family protein [Bacteroidales bacterium]|nr:DUF4831 family protein [Bacteroidales bacterium]
MSIKFLHSVLILTGMFMLLSCSPAGKISVSNVNDTKSISAGSEIYSLPLTIIDVTVYAEEITIVPGPYHEYADKYLSIENVPAAEKKVWTISDIRLGLHEEVDPDFVFCMEKTGRLNQFPGIERLLEDSLILFPGNFPGKILFYNTLPDREDDIHYFDLSVKRNFDVEDSEVIVSMVLPGTDEDKRLMNARAQEKTLERKAEEAANFIIKLRKRRFKLVAGQYDYMPEGLAMTEALRQLDKIEEEYLSLFTGKRVTRQHVRTFHFTPGNDVDNERLVLFRFSDTEGFLNASEEQGKPVLLELTNSNKTTGLDGVGPSIRSNNKFIIYRIPDLAYGKILFGEKLIVDAYIPVFQYGKIVTLYP